MGHLSEYSQIPFHIALVSIITCHPISKCCKIPGAPGTLNRVYVSFQTMRHSGVYGVFMIHGLFTLMYNLNLDGGSAKCSHSKRVLFLLLLQPLIPGDPKHHFWPHAPPPSSLACKSDTFSCSLISPPTAVLPLPPETLTFCLCYLSPEGRTFPIFYMAQRVSVNGLLNGLMTGHHQPLFSQWLPSSHLCWAGLGC